MSLDWSITKVKDWQAVSMAEENGIEGTKTNALVWATMTVGLPSITAKNVDEWMRRLALVEKLRGAFINRYIKDDSMPGGLREESYHFTREDIVRRIGLSTNASKLTLAAFTKRITFNKAA